MLNNLSFLQTLKRFTKRQTRIPAGAFVVFVGVLILSQGCAQKLAARNSITPTSTIHMPTATSTSIPTFPAFSDWRATYLASDGRLHAVSLDGKTDVAGPIVPGLTIYGLTFGSGHISPHGHYFADFASGIDIIDLREGASPYHYNQPGAVDTSAWSQDETKLAMSVGAHFWIMNIPSGQPVQIPGSESQSEDELLGWLDATHLAIGGPDPSSVQKLTTGDSIATAFLLESLDITTGKARTLTRFANYGTSIPVVILSPDGAKALILNNPFRDAPFFPVAYELDIASGSMTALPTIAHAFNDGVSTYAWRPGTEQIAVSYGFLVNGDLHTWLLDLPHDTITKVVDGQYAESWSPDGAALAVSTGQDVGIGYGPWDISAVIFAGNGTPIITLLTHDAMTFPFVGFARTSP